MDVCRERSGPPVAPRGPPLSPREILDPYAPALALFRPNPSPEPGFPLLKIYEPPLNAPLPPLLSLSLSLVLSRSLSLARSACLPTTFTRSYTSLAFPRQNQTPPKHERSLVTIPFTTTEDGAQENNSSFFPARDLCLIVVLCTVVQSGEKFVNNNK